MTSRRDDEMGIDEPETARSLHTETKAAETSTSSSTSDAAKTVEQEHIKTGQDKNKLAETHPLSSSQAETPATETASPSTLALPGHDTLMEGPDRGKLLKAFPEVAQHQPEPDAHSEGQGSHEPMFPPDQMAENSEAVYDAFYRVQAERHRQVENYQAAMAHFHSMRNQMLEIHGQITSEIERQEQQYAETMSRLDDLENTMVIEEGLRTTSRQDWKAYTDAAFQTALSEGLGGQSSGARPGRAPEEAASKTAAPVAVEGESNGAQRGTALEEASSKR